MKTFTVEQAASGLDKLVGLALTGEQIHIRSSQGVVELRPAQSPAPTGEHQTPREALRHLQQHTRLTSDDAEAYLRDVRAERLTSDGWLKKSQENLLKTWDNPSDDIFNALR